MVFKLIRGVQPLLEEYFTNESYNLTEMAELNFNLRLLKSQFLEKKIKAINEFKDFIDRVDFHVDIKSLNDKRRMRIFNTEKLREYFLSKNILQILLGINFYKSFI